MKIQSAIDWIQSELSSQTLDVIDDARARLF
jgi:hypothetical protein